MAGANIYWDQVSLLIQIGLLDLAKLPAGAEQPRSSRSKKTTRHIFRSRARWQSDLARNALPRADCRVGLQHHSVLGFGRIERRAALYLYGYRFYRPLDHFCRRSSLRFQRCLQVLDHALKLLVRQALDRIAVLDLHLARHEQGANLHVGRTLRLAPLFNRGRPVLFEVGSEGEQKVLVERPTRSLQGTARVSMPDGSRTS